MPSRANRSSSACSRYSSARALEEHFRLGYALTPHVTLAYYANNICTGGMLQPLRETLGPVELELELPMDGLEFQYFTDMNHYSASPPEP